MAMDTKASMLALAMFSVARIAIGSDPAIEDPRQAEARTLDTVHRFEPPPDRASWERRAESLRLRVRVAAGLVPEPPRLGPNLRSYRTIDRDDYTVENVAFESLPGFFVTGNLYRPKGRAPGTRSPGVLCPHGHWENGRHFERSIRDAEREIEIGAEQGMAGARYPLQARCVQLARMGCVVLIYDMVGYADSRQLGHGAGFGDVESELLGLSAFGLQTWNSIRALDEISALEDVDAERIGVTGASGGGTQTFVLTAIDSRVKVAFPAVMVSSSMQGGCVCENASHLRIGTDNVELAALAAPRPLALTGANDWTKNILEDGFPALKQVYSFFGAEENVAAWCYPQFDHNYNQVAREHMYAWFAKHLGLGIEGSVTERDFVPIPPAELRVFHEGNPLPGTTDVASIRRALAGGIEPRPFVTAMDSEAQQRVASSLRAQLAVLLDHRELGRGHVTRDVTTLPPMEDRESERWILRYEPTGETVHATFLPVPGEDRAPIVVVGRDAEGVIEELGEESSFPWNHPVVCVDPIPAKDGAFLRRDGSRHSDFVGYTTCYDTVLVAERVRDLTIVSTYLEERYRSVAGYVGFDDDAWTLLLARALAPRHQRKRAVFLDLRDALRPIDSFSDERFVPGLARLGRAENLLALLAPAAVSVVTANPIPIDVRNVFTSQDEPFAHPRTGLSVTPPDRIDSALTRFLYEYK